MPNRARPRVLVLTSRSTYRLASYGMVIDFEDAIARAADVDMVEVPLASRRTLLTAVAHGHNPLVSAPRRDYDVAVLVAMGAQWLPGLRLVRGLRSVARRVIVYLFDSWLSDLPEIGRMARTWSLVDDLFVSFEHTAAAYDAALPCRVHHLAQATDPRWFRPVGQRRPIDAISVGRRENAVHRHLLAISEERDLLYFFQTHLAPNVIDFAENQMLLGRMCGAARVHVSWAVDATHSKRAAEGAAVTARWFEAAASGGVVIGRAPSGPEFERLFPMDGFVREIPAAAATETREALLAALDDDRRSDREALAEHVRTMHTWDARWREMAMMAGLVAY